MRKIRLFVIMCACLMAVNPVQAKPKHDFFAIQVWDEKHWRDLDFEPYTNDANSVLREQYYLSPEAGGKNTGWTPEVWTAQRGGIDPVLSGFYKANILNDQYTKRGHFVLEVGPNFYMLSGYDKRRVLAMVDAKYRSLTEGVFSLRDWKTKKEIGLYTPYGVQLQ